MTETGTSIILNLLIKRESIVFNRDNKDILHSLINDKMNIQTMKFIVSMVREMDDGEIREVMDRLDRAGNDMFDI